MSNFVRGIMATLLGLWVLVSIGWFILAIGFAGSIASAFIPPEGSANQLSFYFSWFIIIGPWVLIAFLFIRKKS